MQILALGSFSSLRWLFSAVSADATSTVCKVPSEYIRDATIANIPCHGQLTGAGRTALEDCRLGFNTVGMSDDETAGLAVDTRLWRTPVVHELFHVSRLRRRSSRNFARRGSMLNSAKHAPDQALYSFYGSGNVESPTVRTSAERAENRGERSPR